MPYRRGPTHHWKARLGPKTRRALSRCLTYARLMDGLYADDLLGRMASTYLDRYRRRAKARYGDADYPVSGLKDRADTVPMPDLKKPAPVVD